MYSLKSPDELAHDISQRVKQRRIHQNITQRELAERSGVSFGSIKRFEQKGEISLKHLLQIAIVLQSTQEFDTLFEEQEYQSIEDVIKEKAKKQRKRAAKDDT